MKASGFKKVFFSLWVCLVAATGAAVVFAYGTALLVRKEGGWVAMWGQPGGRMEPEAPQRTIQIRNRRPLPLGPAPTAAAAPAAPLREARGSFPCGALPK
jgi:hypothetical protein